MPISKRRSEFKGNEDKLSYKPKAPRSKFTAFLVTCLWGQHFKISKMPFPPQLSRTLLGKDFQGFSSPFTPPLVTFWSHVMIVFCKEMHSGFVLIIFLATEKGIFLIKGKCWACLGCVFCSLSHCKQNERCSQVCERPFPKLFLPHSSILVYMYALPSSYACGPDH